MRRDMRGPDDEHLRTCAGCRKRLEFLHRIVAEAILIGREIDLDPDVVALTMVDAGASLADRAGSLPLQVQHMATAAKEVSAIIVHRTIFGDD